MDIREFFSEEIWDILCPYCANQEGLTEIRFRVGKPVFCYVEGVEKEVQRSGKTYLLGELDMKQMLYKMCRYSLYAYEEERKKGFLTLRGGHRLGLAGEYQISENQLRDIKNISSLNFRVAHEKKGIAKGLLKWCYRNGRVENILIISPPGCGKTTLLRELIRNVSNGTSFGKGENVTVVDERSEIGGCYQGIPQNDLGLRTDCMDAVSKKEGILLAIRSLTPEVVAVDEIGNHEEEVLLNAMYCGVSLLMTAHGNGIEDVMEHTQLGNLIRNGKLNRFIEIHNDRNQRCYWIRNKSGEILDKVSGL